MSISYGHQGILKQLLAATARLIYLFKMKSYTKAHKQKFKKCKTTKIHVQACNTIKQYFKSACLIWLYVHAVWPLVIRFPYQPRVAQRPASCCILFGTALTGGIHWKWTICHYVSFQHLRRLHFNVVIDDVEDVQS